MEGNINAQPKYILCTKSKSQHRKAIAVCRQCDDRENCDEYQQVQEAWQVEEVQEALQFEEIQEARQFEEIHEVRQVEEIQETRQVRQTRQPELVQAMDTLVLAFNKKQLRPKEAKTLKRALEELSALFKES